MIYLKLFEGFSDIKDICKKYRIKNYTINSDGSIDVDGDVNIAYMKLDKLPLRFNRIGGNFDCSVNHLTSLIGAPKEIGGNFYCNNNQLTSLEGAPKEVGGFFDCDKNPLPQLIIDNDRYIDEIIKWQDEYNIWRNGNLDEFRFSEMMIDIKEELKK